MMFTNSHSMTCETEQRFRYAEHRTLESPRKQLSISLNCFDWYILRNDGCPGEREHRGKASRPTASWRELGCLRVSYNTIHTQYL